MFETALILKFVTTAFGIYAVGFAAGKAAAWVRAIGTVG